MTYDEVKSLVVVSSNIDQIGGKAVGLANQGASTTGTLVNISLSGASLSSPIGSGNAARPIDVATVERGDSIPTS